MRVLLIYTGGTIGSSENDGWIAPDGKNDSLLVHKYRSRFNDYITEFDTVKPYSILSENLTANEINMLIKTISENIDKGYDGIIVTHGSDTLQYSAAGVSYAFSTAQIPIIFVCSAYTLDDKRENGTANFCASVEFIKSKKADGVFVSYKNDNDSYANIHKATRIIQHMESSADIFSIDNNPFAKFDDGIIINTKYRKGDICDFCADIEYCDDPKILVIESHPGDNYAYSLNDVKVIIIKPYHSGTLNTSNQHFQHFCLLAKDMKIPIFIVNVKDGVAYESSKLFDNLSLTVLPYCTFISAYVKCWLAVSGGFEIKDFVMSSLSEEFLYESN